MVRGDKSRQETVYFQLINSFEVQQFHSVRKLFTGVAIAAFIAWKLTVTNAINMAIIPASTNTHH